VSEAFLDALAGWMSRKVLDRYSHSRMESKRDDSRLVGEAGLEPTTPGLEGRCSIQLSYSPVSAIVSPPGATSKLRQRNISMIAATARSRAWPQHSSARCAVAPQPSTNQVTP
jgi:hypothetical protein